MAGRDLHSKPFDESTIAKLEIFEDYAEAWIPTFVMQSRPIIHIFDFFAGTGYDKKGIKGSPMRILGKVKSQIGNIFQKRTKIVVHLNEFEPNKKEQKKFKLLKNSCDQYLADNKDVGRAIEVKYYNEDCESLFPKLMPAIKKYPSLVYLDQNGIKFLSDLYFLELESCRETDFLYFVSSSYFWRFADHNAFKTHFDLNIADAKKDPYKFIHKNVLKELKKRLPKGSSLKLYPYTLKKSTNIHGIIFGASHPRAVDKFLTIAWKRNELNGEANFDINNDKPNNQLSIFGPKKSKRDIFEEKIKNLILNKDITNNFQAYGYSLDNGHIGNHAAIAIRRMKKNGSIHYNSTSPLVTYDNVYKKKKLLEYKTMKE
jgi:three-Cys-motif partner protein